jgi:hypothetical protein
VTNDVSSSCGAQRSFGNRVSEFDSFALVVIPWHHSSLLEPATAECRGLEKMTEIYFAAVRSSIGMPRAKATPSP